MRGLAQNARAQAAQNTRQLAAVAVLCGFIFLLCPASACADELVTRADPRSLAERISAPDMSREVKASEFRTGTSRSSGASESRQKDFYWVQKSLVEREFRTNSFYGDRRRSSVGNSFGSKIRFGAGRAYFGKVATQEREKRSFRTHEVATNQARYAQRSVRTGEARAVAGKPFTGRGTAQGSIDQMVAQGEALTVDQVREILNRNQ